MSFDCDNCGCEWEAQIENADNITADLKCCPMCVESEEEEGDNDDEDEDVKIAKKFKKEHARKPTPTKYSKEFIDFCKENIDRYTNQDLVDIAARDFNIETDITKLPGILHYRKILRTPKGKTIEKPEDDDEEETPEESSIVPNRDEEREKLEEIAEEEQDRKIEKYIAGHTGTKNKRLVKEIKAEFGVWLTAHKVAAIKRSLGYKAPKTTPEEGLDVDEAFDDDETHWDTQPE